MSKQELFHKLEKIQETITLPSGKTVTVNDISKFKELIEHLNSQKSKLKAQEKPFVCFDYMIKTLKPDEVYFFERESKKTYSYKEIKQLMQKDRLDYRRMEMEIFFYFPIHAGPGYIYKISFQKYEDYYTYEEGECMLCDNEKRELVDLGYEEFINSKRWPTVFKPTLKIEHKIDTIPKYIEDLTNFMIDNPDVLYDY